jgi:hypothetical protein
MKAAAPTAALSDAYESYESKLVYWRIEMLEASSSFS